MVKVTFTGGTPLEALADLTAFGMFYMSNPDVAAAANRIFSEGKSREEKRKAAPEPVRAAAEEPPAAPEPVRAAAEEPPFEAAPASDPGTEAAPVKTAEAVKVPVLEEVRAAGIEASRKYGQAAVKSVLERFGAPNMTGLRESDRAAFVEALKGLGDGDA